MLGSDPGRSTVRPAEHDRAAHLSAGHVERLRRRIDDLIHRLHREVERHEFDDRLQACHRRANADAGKAVLGDRRVDDAPGAEFLQQPLRHLVGALIFRDLLAHDEDIAIAPHFFRHRIAQRFADGHGHHLGAFGDFRIGLGDGLWSRGCFPVFAAGLGLSGSFRFGLSRRRLRGLLLLPGRRCRLGKIGGVFAVGQNGRDRRVDGDVRRAFRDQDLAERALVGRLDFHRRLVGFDLGDDIA